MNEADVALKPKNLTMEEAASIPLVGLTAWQVLVEKAKLKKGQKVLIHAGSGGVGTFAIQLAKHLGATVATTTSTANIDLVKSLGADIVIDYKKDDFEKILSGYDVVLNSLDSGHARKIPHRAEARRKADFDLRSAGCRFRQGEWSELVLAAGHAPSELRHPEEGQTPAHQLFVCFHEGEGEQLSKITSLIESGIIRPVMDRVFPFEATNEALAYIETGRAKGKVVVKVR